MLRRFVFSSGALLSAFAGAGCAGVQSALDPAGVESSRIATLFWWMTGGAVVVWIGVIALAFACVRASDGRHSPAQTRLLIVWGGVALPTVVLAGLLVYGLMLLPPLVARAPEGSLQISVVGEQWWWRVRYEPPGRPPIELANEIRLPVGERVQFRLESDNVIHSFWIPSLGGKMDMIPGRTTYLALQATRTGVYRGACAEYCGTAHAQMAFAVEVMAPDAFERWLDAQARPARMPADAIAIRGAERFAANGCGACHRIAGTPAAGTIGPDLTHVGSRRSIGAALLPNGVDAVRRWIAETDALKPGVHMPRFGMLPADDLQAMAAYLRALE